MAMAVQVGAARFTTPLVIPVFPAIPTVASISHRDLFRIPPPIRPADQLREAALI